MADRALGKLSDNALRCYVSFDPCEVGQEGGVLGNVESVLIECPPQVRHEHVQPEVQDFIDYMLLELEMALGTQLI
jgi:hypothetical protein